MKLFALLSVVLAGSHELPYFPNREECLTVYLANAIEDNPDKACAIVTLNKYRLRGNWFTYEKLQCTHFWFELFCARKGDTNNFLQRLGDGGMMNWRYDGYSFRREGDKIFVL
ncbi:hypothetical protein DSO57_1036715 [Entomophthora muscae]|uniref:Uncharacterized protein n=3 Tax=Entomophthora muscae TaxID=34485 RepID=A0ACC2U7X8_9FUNG|nr:hypothetical protein DSO57_1014665 [Entomophthora muscae]KAJ9083139.1 hypothetical protein DSO57_1037724 [Entomophthora muscae]KAJ9087094.1 hypothetical protein DSO57_1036715 [Entomophthora muscae]